MSSNRLCAIGGKCKAVYPARTGGSGWGSKSSYGGRLRCGNQPPRLVGKSATNLCPTCEKQVFHEEEDAPFDYLRPGERRQDSAGENQEKGGTEAPGLHDACRRWEKRRTNC